MVLIQRLSANILAAVTSQYLSIANRVPDPTPSWSKWVMFDKVGLCPKQNGWMFIQASCYKMGFSSTLTWRLLFWWWLAFFLKVRQVSKACNYYQIKYIYYLTNQFNGKPTDFGHQYMFTKNDAVISWFQNPPCRWNGMVIKISQQENNISWRSLFLGWMEGRKQKLELYTHP